ncbi:MAG: glucosamine-6-phosphate deaminase, partial [Chloroflexi bacterium]|nr:glucosamine-6-phosphate deaminase [Chloroflexota bacterium]
MNQRPTPQRTFAVEKLQVEVFATRAHLGAAAADDAAAQMRVLIREQGTVRMVFAAAPSQNEFLAELGRLPGIDWGRVVAFHMDEYVGLGPDAPQSFARFLREHLFQRVRPGQVHYLNGLAPDPQAECSRYAALLAQAPIDIVCAGIGENGHLAFNDPP